MEKKILCLLLLVALCAAAASGSHQRTRRQLTLHPHWAQCKPRPPLTSLQKCCGYPYFYWIKVLFERPGHKRFNRFLHLALKFAWMLRHSRRRGRCCGLRRRAWKLKKHLIRCFSHYWYRCSPVRTIRWLIITGARGLEAYLRRYWRWLVKKANAKKLALLKKWCFIQMQKESKVHGPKVFNCWWWKCCAALLKPVPPIPPTTAPPCTTTPCVPAPPPPPIPSTRMVQKCFNTNNQCPPQFWRWVYQGQGPDRVLILCEPSDATCITATATAAPCAPTSIEQKELCLAIDQTTFLDCGDTAPPYLPGCFNSTAPGVSGLRKICPAPGTLYNGCDWFIVDEENVQGCTGSNG